MHIRNLVLFSLVDSNASGNPYFLLIAIEYASNICNYTELQQLLWFLVLL